MKNTLLVLLGFFFFYSCVEEPKTEQKPLTIDQEIAQLDSDEKLKAYWEEIARLDQVYRILEDSIILNFGHDSPQHKEHWQLIFKTDGENLIKTEKLLAKYGYPQRTVLGEDAAAAPWMAIHHAQTYEERERNFPILFKAYNNGNLDEGFFSAYLNRMYYIKERKRYEVGGVFSEEKRINDLMAALNLNP